MSEAEEQVRILEDSKLAHAAWPGWGWTHYKWTYWQRDDGYKAYIGYFKRPVLSDDVDRWNAGDHTYSVFGEYIRVEVLFWSKHPVLAMRAICQSGKDPATFREMDVK